MLWVGPERFCRVLFNDAPIIEDGYPVRQAEKDDRIMGYEQHCR